MSFRRFRFSGRGEILFHNAPKDFSPDESGFEMTGGCHFDDTALAVEEKSNNSNKNKRFLVATLFERTLIDLFRADSDN